ncbi:MAG: YjfB family protein [Spirochaetaceae bacterium]
MNIPEASTALSLNRIQQQVQTGILRMGMDNAEKQGEAVTQMAENAGEVTRHNKGAAAEADVFQESHLGNKVDIRA